MKKRQIIIIGLLTTILFSVFGTWYYFSLQKPETQDIPDNSSPPNTHYLSVDSLPTLPPEKGAGIDTESLLIKLSEQEISNLAPSLPYQKEFTTTVGIPIEVLIPDRKYADNLWTVQVHIQGPEYEVGRDDDEYEDNKQAFLEGADDVFSYFSRQDIDASKLIIEWGDRKIIKDQSERWLSER